MNCEISVHTSFPICSECGISFSDLVMHINIAHNGEQERRCVYCARLFENLDALLDHLGCHNGSVCCYICKRKFKEHEQLIFDHIDTHRELHLFGCKLCYWTTANYFTYLNHHCNKTLVEEEQNRKIVSIPKNSVTRMKNPSEESVNEEKLTLDCVSTKPRDAKTLRFFAQCLGDDGYYHCTECLKRLKSQRGFKYHIMKHLNLMKFVCSVCDFKFPNNNKLLIHKKVHEPSRVRYDCKDCDKSYLTRSACDSHYNITHLGGYICTFCSIKLSKAKMTLHRTKINCCGEHFMCQGLYRFHLLRKKHSFPCSHCGKSFRTDLELKRHYSWKHRDLVGTHQCPKCDLLFSGRKNLTRHIARNHRFRIGYKEIRIKRKEFSPSGPD